MKTAQRSIESLSEQSSNLPLRVCRVRKAKLSPETSEISNELTNAVSVASGDRVDYCREMQGGPRPRWDLVEIEEYPTVGLHTDESCEEVVGVRHGV